MGIYLDNAATSYPKPESVVEAVADYIRYVGANAGRAAYAKALQASRLVFETREAVAQIIGVRDSSRVVFTGNATEALNLAILGLRLAEGDEVVTSGLEHNSVMRPLRYLEKEKGVKIVIARGPPDGRLTLDELAGKVTSKTRLIVVNHASNVVGTILPVREIGRVARQHNITFLVDAAQTAGCVPISVDEDNVDLLAFSGHKGLLGPQGIGCLYVRAGIGLAPLKFGGTGSHSEHELQPDFLPDMYESGTLNLPGIAGLKAGIEFLNREGVENIRSRVQQLTGTLIQRLSELKGTTIYGTGDENRQTGVVSINLARREPSEIAEILDRVHDVSVRAGLHCSPQAHKTIGTFPSGTVRISLGPFNTGEHIDAVCSALCRTIGS